MRLANIIAGSAFRVSVQLLAVFVVMLVLAGMVLVTAVTNTLENETRAQLEEESLLLEDIYDAEGLSGLTSSIEELAKQSVFFDRALGLFDENRIHLAGQVSLMPGFVGWRKTHLMLLEPPSGEEQNYHARVFQLDRMTLVVGRSTAHIDAARQQLIIWLLVTGICLSLGTLLLGYLASRRSYRKLYAMGQVLKTIASGDMSARIPVSDTHDQIDLLAIQVNAQLQHLATLVNGIQTTATAIAHDLKTPLSHAQIALYEAGDKCDQGQDPEQEISQALSKLEQLNQTFDTILRISRIQAQTDKSSFALVELHALVEKIFDLLEPGAQDAGMELSVVSHLQSAKQDSHQEALELYCDAGMLQQLLINLLTNAITHCAAGSRIQVSAEQTAEAIVLTVEDNGPGIPDSEREDIFKPFTRLSQPRTTPGNGLGLALVKAIADAHHARIQLSDASPGLRIQVLFPKQ
ncbi:HAMP domain-containing sensor histidine kinase [Aliamphritea ceti]|uniref:HAMP domain-containing sensor histidine kinase n=1 Tax=Aliamphritea ceti TaxID=1524258 RepID=UPI0021C4B2D8|nr:HAMP domain-containing histidine kinase [Aliamphritea ceti]